MKLSDVDKLYNAISKLKPSEQELIHKLYLSKNPITQAEQSLQEKSRRIRRKLEKLLKYY